LCFSSVADPHGGSWREVEADAIYQLSLQSKVEPASSTSTDSLLSVSFASMRRHSWEEHATEGAVSIILGPPL
jgi:hypothetical protein